jgi:hypothetical protein
MVDMVLIYTTRVRCKREVAREEVAFSLKHHWRFFESEILELQGFS